MSTFRRLFSGCFRRRRQPTLKKIKLQNLRDDFNIEITDNEGIQLEQCPHPLRRGSWCYRARAVPLSDHGSTGIPKTFMSMEEAGFRKNEPITLKVWTRGNGNKYLTMHNKYTAPPSLPIEIIYVMALGHNPKNKAEVRELYFELKTEKFSGLLPISTPNIPLPNSQVIAEDKPVLNRVDQASCRQHLSQEKKRQAIGRMEAGQSQAEVARWLGVTRSVVSKLWKKFQTTANVARTAEQGRPRVTTLNQDRYLSLLVRRNRRMTASQLRSDLNAAKGVLVSTDTIRRRLHKKGLYARRPIICVPLTPPKKRARKLWCRQHVAWNPDEWRRVIITDESRFSLNSDSCRVFVWREVGTRNNPRNIVEKDPYRSQGFMVWAGIFLGGRTALHIFRQGTLTGQRYRDEILAAYHWKLGENFLLMDDNARPHRAGVVDTFLQNLAIARMNWPARSPDLNPIEHVWDNLGRRISSLQPSSRNTHELETALTQEWALIPQELINSLILSMGHRCRACLSVKGDHTPY
ncbi:hypothetical protein LAZ67_23000615 [Cordylochernes scorpioides]|uniref:Transposase n=1 Tax=Cordylochernes scorpioides TaxID=51811 RepID=A0ABY6LQ43_9ARAC|nr:hypothetical protein LAZ67_23000615 [Cordylochernes scorpioides]